MKTKGRVPKRPLGVGYDSEASDCEEDPMITEAIILRMAPGPDCDYLRSAVAAGNLGLTTNTNAGADIRLRFLRSDGRRACIKIRENYYAAILVDLPCVIEAMKSWFPKTMGWMKSADICQMLLVLGKIGNEEDALEYPLPKGAFDEKTWQWAHGLTPPMHWVRKRRFRKRISVRTVMEVEAEVEEMLRLDALCEGAPIIEDIYEHPNRNNNSDQGSDDEGDENGYEDAEGDLIDEQSQVPETPLDTISAAEDEEAAHARMAEEYEREMMLASTTIDPPLPSTSTNPLTSDSPATQTPRPSSPSSSSASSSPSSSSSTEENLTSDQRERAQEMQKLKEEIRDLDELIKAERGKLEATGNQLLRRRVVERIRGLVQDRELKVAGME
jgi:transcription initiation factor TFIID subunit 7